MRLLNATLTVKGIACEVNRSGLTLFIAKFVRGREVPIKKKKKSFLWMEVLEAPSAEIQEFLDELEYEKETLRFPRGRNITVRTVDEIPIELLTLLQDAKAEISGRRVWPGSVLLALAMTQEEPPVGMPGATVLELGAGSGLAGMVAERLGAARVVITDGDQTSCDLAAQNCGDNRIICDQSEGSRVQVERLLWGEGAHADAFRAAIAPSSGFDVILAADVMYKPSLPPLLFTTMKGFLAPGGAALLCHLERAGVTQEVVLAAAAVSGLTATKLDLPVSLLPHDHCSVDEASGACIYLLRHTATATGGSSSGS